ncbi:MAG: phosphoribosylamine--glycine ligase [Sphingorhabdus lacus]|jgi:phosphoribosylamine--glycine ligase
MNILLIGSGGREHALAWKLAQSPSCDTLYAAPGNPGIAEDAELVDLNVSDHAAVISFCAGHDIGLVVVGPEGPLVDGLGDSLREAGISVFGPNRNAAQLEGSKGFTKDMCAAANIPTAGYRRHDSKASALAGLDEFKPPYVIKADGLAAGKGVIIAESKADAEAAIEDMFGGGFGDAGAAVVLEEFMTGEEVSFFALTDGRDVVAFGSAQDHKRVGDGDTGPNTGGMGAYSPAPVLTQLLQDEVMERIIQPTVGYMAEQGMPYSGVLFAGLMLTEEGPKLIEYNARFGDPECQVLMSRFQGDLVTLMHAVATGGLSAESAPGFSPNSALTVVMAAQGYPGTPQKGGAISIDYVTQAKVFHAGTAEKEGQLVANGGRVLNVTAMGVNVTEAQRNAYAAIEAIDFPTGFYRRDIGWREVERESAI